jgi:hypothetical protein
VPVSEEGSFSRNTEWNQVIGSQVTQEATSLTAFCVSKNTADDSTPLMDQTECGRG